MSSKHLEGKYRTVSNFGKDIQRTRTWVLQLIKDDVLNATIIDNVWFVTMDAKAQKAIETYNEINK